MAVGCWIGWAVQAWAGPELLVSLERDFAASVAARGFKAGFLQYLAPDGWLFRPRPVAGLAYLEGAPEDPGLLEWAPSYARLAKSGDLGFTTGPWRYRESRTNAAVNANGQYLTVWQATPSGWKVVLDAGVGGPAMSFPWRVDADGPDDADEPLAAWEQTQRGRDLKFVEETYGRRSAREGEASAVEAHGHKRVRVLRPGAPPVVGRSDAVRFLAANRRKTRDALQGVVISGGGDLGYAWGESELLGSGTTPPQAVRSWARVWRRSGWSGTWRVALDLAVDYPETPKR